MILHILRRDPGNDPAASVPPRKRAAVLPELSSEVAGAEWISPKLPLTTFGELYLGSRPVFAFQTGNPLELAQVRGHQRVALGHGVRGDDGVECADRRAVSFEVRADGTIDRRDPVRERRDDDRGEKATDGLSDFGRGPLGEAELELHRRDHADRELFDLVPVHAGRMAGASPRRARLTVFVSRRYRIVTCVPAGEGIRALRGTRAIAEIELGDAAEDAPEVRGPSVLVAVFRDRFEDELVAFAVNEELRHRDAELAR